jgi:hypothetical protein
VPMVLLLLTSYLATAGLSKNTALCKNKANVDSRCIKHKICLVQNLVLLL